MNNVISTRVRFARNISGYPFKGKMTESQTKEMIEKVKSAAKETDASLDCLDMSSINDIRAGSLVEQHLISPDFIKNRQNEYLILSKDGEVSVMVNEEDHLRIQAIKHGLDIQGAYEKAVEIEKALDEKLKFEYSDDLGYLTRCPTNLGTAMRASVMLHLPALTETGGISQLPSFLTQYGFTLRGMYGEGSKVGGAVYQISNEITLGITEEEILERLSEVTKKICDTEKKMSKKLVSSVAVCDRIYRSYGVLSQARIISSAECMTCLSDLRLGAEAGLFELPEEKTDSLFIQIQPCSMELEGGNRDEKRAEKMRKEMKEFNI